MSALKAWMDRAKETDATLARRVGVSRVQISRVRRAICKPSLDLAAKLEEVTGIPAATFARGDSQPGQAA